MTGFIALLIVIGLIWLLGADDTPSCLCAMALILVPLALWVVLTVAGAS